LEDALDSRMWPLDCETCCIEPIKFYFVGWGLCLMWINSGQSGCLNNNQIYMG